MVSSLVGYVLSSIASAIFGALVRHFWPVKTAADVKADQATADQKAQENANAIETKVTRENDSDVDAALAARVRDPVT
jgi:hypothetical protein